MHGIPDSAFIEQQQWRRDVLLSVVSAAEALLMGGAATLLDTLGDIHTVECEFTLMRDTINIYIAYIYIYIHLHIWIHQPQLDKTLHRLKRQIADSGSLDHSQQQLLLDTVTTIWSDANMRKLLARRERGFHHYFPLPKGASYLCDERNLERICHGYYLPTVPDYIKSYNRTAAAATHELQFENMRFELVDLGGHPSQRSKWSKFLHAAEGEDSVYQVWFVADLSAFNEYTETRDHPRHQTVEKNHAMRTRLQESLDLFESVARRLLAEDKVLILVLTMYDRFVHKIRRLGLNMAHFGFSDGEFDSTRASDVDYCIRFVISQFTQRIRKHFITGDEKKIRVYVINPQDRKTVAALCEAATELKSIYHMDNRCINVVRLVQKEIATGARPGMGSFVLGLGSSFGSFRQISKDDSDLPNSNSRMALPHSPQNMADIVSNVPIPSPSTMAEKRRSSSLFGHQHSPQHQWSGPPHMHHAALDDINLCHSPSRTTSNFVPTGSFRAGFTSMLRTDSVAMNISDVIDQFVQEESDTGDWNSDFDDHGYDGDEYRDYDGDSGGDWPSHRRARSDMTQFTLETLDKGNGNTRHHRSTSSDFANSSVCTANATANIRRNQKLDLAKSFRNIKHMFAIKSQQEDDGKDLRPPRKLQTTSQSTVSPTSPIKYPSGPSWQT